MTTKTDPIKTNENERNNVKILIVIFYLSLAAHFLGIFTFPIRDVIVGLSALGLALTTIGELFSGK